MWEGGNNTEGADGYAGEIGTAVLEHALVMWCHVVPLTVTHTRSHGTKYVECDLCSVAPCSAVQCYAVQCCAVATEAG